jgi:hypothetical protein
MQHLQVAPTELKEMLVILLQTVRPSGAKDVLISRSAIGTTFM